VADSALAPTDNPIDTLKVEFVDWSKKRLRANEPNRGWDLPQGVGSRGNIHVFDGRPNPYVVGPGQTVGQSQGALRSLAEYLELMPMCAIHHVEDALNQGEREMSVENI